MKTFITLLFTLLLLPGFSGQAAVVLAPSLPELTEPGPVILPQAPAAASVVPTTRKKGLLYRLIQKWVQPSISATDEITPRQKKQALWSLILGVGGLILAFIPYVGLLSVPAAIAAIFLGIKSLKGNANSKGIIGIIAGSTLIVAILFVVAFFVFTFRFE